MKKYVILAAYLVSICLFYHKDPEFHVGLDEMISGSKYNILSTPAHGFMDWFYIRGSQAIDRAMYGYSRPFYRWIEDIAETNR